MNPSKRALSEGPEDNWPYFIVQSQPGNHVKLEKIIISNEEFLIGRSLDASFNLKDPTISRQQCVIKKEATENSESSWFIHQLGSCVSWVNAKNVKKGEKVELKTGDLVEFNDDRSYSFKFYAPVLESECKRARQLREEEQEKVENLSEKLVASEQEQERTMKEKAELELKMQERIQQLEADYLRAKEELEARIQTENLEKQKLAEEKALIEERLAQEKLLAEQKFTDEKQNLESKLKGLEETVKKIEEEKLRKEEERKILEEEAEKIKATLAEKEAALLETANQLKKDGEYEENIKKMTEELEKMKEDLNGNLNKQSQLEKQLTETAGSSYLLAKTELLESFGEVIESELQCSICSELYVEAVSLNCMHTFCKYCLNKWKKRKKECPVCRAKIKTENRCFIWDSFIDKMVEKLSEDLKARRKALVAERTGKSTNNKVQQISLISNGNGQYTVTTPNTTANLTPNIINAQRIRIAVPISSSGVVRSPNLTNVPPGVGMPYIPSVRLLGSIDLTRAANAGRNLNTPHATPSRPASMTVPNILTPNRSHSHTTPSSSSSSISPSRRFNRVKARRRRVPGLEPVVREEIITIPDVGVASTSSSTSRRPPPRVDESVIEIPAEESVIEIPDEPTSSTATNATNRASNNISDSDSDDNLIIVPIRRKSSIPSSSTSTQSTSANDSTENTSANNSTENNVPQPSTSSSNSSNSNTNSRSRKRPPTEPIVLSSSDSNTDSDESSVEGLFDYGYEGGRCWDCGKRGHWARACPYN